MKILVTVPMTEEQRRHLTEQMPDAEYRFTTRKEVKEETVREADIILGKVPLTMLPPADTGHLKWIQLSSAGYEDFAAPGVLPEGTLLTNATGAYDLTVSEHMLAMTFFLKRKFGRYYSNQMKGVWKEEGRVTAVAGSRTLVLGLGNIGGAYARKMSALGSRVTGIKRTRTKCPDYLEAVGTMEETDSFLPEADIVAMVLPDTPQTYHIMDRRRLSLMKKGSILLNVGRGTAIDQDALADALKSGHLAGAAIDVTDPEPLPPEHPLWKCGNLLITPHVAGGFYLQETLDSIAELMTDNLGRYARGERLRNLVQPSRGSV